MSVFVICEAGVNHNGNLETALKLVDVAKKAGADAVKFQAFNAARLKRPEIKHLELSEPQLRDIAAYAKAAEIEFMCTAFDPDWLVYVDKFVKRHKIASGCLENWPLLDSAKLTGKPIILSTGMSDVNRIGRAFTRIQEQHVSDWIGKHAILHCVSAYPCPTEAANLKAMDTLIWQWGDKATIGYSDHTLGITVPIAAVGRGAQIIEKHLTLDRSAEGPDHKASIEPEEFRVMVSAIRTVEAALGDGIKGCQPCEEPTARIWYGS